MECATALGSPSRPVAEECKVVTIVFCDLVSFTARSEVLDPEDVRAFLLPYYDVLTSEIECHGDDRQVLPALVRTALGLGDLALAERLEESVVPRHPYSEHALVAADAAMTEARGNLQSAADAYTDAADRRERFGALPEQAFALLGQGRCLIGLSQPTEAAAFLQKAREIFERLEAAPALTETDALLERATARGA
jgi:tetratricopeptide (TPR) repeat protein